MLGPHDNEGNVVMSYPNGYTDGGGIRSNRIQTALVAKMPQPIDVKNDIVKQGVADKFQREIVSALRTRNVLACCEEEAPTITQIIRANRGISVAEAEEMLDNILTTRQRDQTEGGRGPAPGDGQVGDFDSG